MLVFVFEVLRCIYDLMAYESSNIQNMQTILVTIMEKRSLYHTFGTMAADILNSNIFCSLLELNHTARQIGHSILPSAGMLRCLW